jgi:hypothetical protein
MVGKRNQAGGSGGCSLQLGQSRFKTRSIEPVLFTVSEPSKALIDAGYFYGIYTLKDLARVL